MYVFCLEALSLIQLTDITNAVRHNQQCPPFESRGKLGVTHQSRVTPG